VVDDMLRMFTSFRPKFVKRYAELGQDAEAVIAAYAREVRERRVLGTEQFFFETPKSGKRGDVA
jgi:3-methyl-2-oxobutanoate hydroxymethyltransferase